MLTLLTLSAHTLPMTQTLLTPGAGSYHLPSAQTAADGGSLTLCGKRTAAMREIQLTPDYACRQCQAAYEGAR